MNIDYLDSLECKTPAEGTMLAFALARKTIAAIQANPEVRKELRLQYAKDTAQHNCFITSRSNRVSDYSNGK